MSSLGRMVSWCLWSVVDVVNLWLGCCCCFLGMEWISGGFV